MKLFVAVLLFLAAAPLAAEAPCSLATFAHETGSTDAAFTLTRLEVQPRCTVGSVTGFVILRGDRKNRIADQLHLSAPIGGWKLTVGKKLVPWGYATPSPDKKPYIGGQPGNDETVFQTGVEALFTREKRDALRMGLFDRDSRSETQNDRSFMARYERQLSIRGHAFTIAATGRKNITGERHEKLLIDATTSFGNLGVNIAASSIRKEARISENWVMLTYKAGKATPYVLIQSHQHAQEYGVVLDVHANWRVRAEYQRNHSFADGDAWLVQLQPQFRFEFGG